MKQGKYSKKNSGNGISSYGWLFLCAFFFLFLVIAYKIVDTPDLVGAAEIKATPDNIELEMFYDDLEELALCAEPEAGSADEECLRATVDTLINRKVDPRFPNTFREVFAQPGQFETYKYHDTVNPSDRTYRICREQLEYYWEHGETQHPGAFYFRTGHYHSFGKQLYKVGAHYFSGI